MSKPGLLTLTIKDKSALYLAYMPYVINGGLFIPTNSSYRLGDEVFMLLNLICLLYTSDAADDDYTV